MLFNIFKRNLTLVLFLIILSATSFFAGYFPAKLLTSDESSASVSSDITITHNPSASSTDTPDIYSSVPVCKYVAKEFNNSIGIFNPQTLTEPLFIIETSVRTLPEKDRMMLADGISIYSVDELQMLIEDYSS